MKLERLMHTDLSVLADRGAQEARKWLERTHLAPWTQAANAPIPEEIARAARGVRDAAPSEPRLRFFRGAFEGAPELIAQSCPGAVAETLRAAERCRAGRFDLLGYRGLSFGSPIDWHLDPVHGRRSPRVHWSRIHPLDPAQVGDSKVIWELNRCQWWVTLARAYSHNGDRMLPAAIAAQARAWRGANPPGIGVNWSSSLEVSLRLIAWCWSAFLLRRELPLSELEALLFSIREHARHVSRYLSHHFSPNTHLTGEALGLFYAGCALPELDDAASWRATGAQILVEQLHAQTHADGIYFEQAACYQRYTADIYLHFLILAAASGYALPTEVGEATIRLLDSLLAMRKPDGALPPIGDADGGWLLPLAERGPADLRGLFSTAAAWFCRADYAWAAQGLAPETLWLLGQEGHDAFSSLSPAPPEPPPSRLFPSGGYAVMADGWLPDSHQLIFDCGPLGCPISGGHGHADLLSIQCSIFGEPAICDPGTCVYTGAWREHLRSTHAHSTITIDGEDQARTSGPFGWVERPRARLHRWRSGALLDVAEASHDAYARLEDPVRHRRRVLFANLSGQRFWVLLDELEGAAEHRLDLRFQLAPLWTRREGPPEAEWVRAVTPGGHALLVRAFANVPLELSIHEGALEPMQGWIAPDYGQRTPAPLLVYSATAKLPLRIATLLFPLERAADPAPELTALFAPSGPTALLFGDGQQLQLDGNTSASAAR